MRNTVLLLAVIIAISGLSKTAAFFHVQNTDQSKILMPDSGSYLSTAQGLLHTGRFVLSPERADLPQLERTPGYPFFIAVIFFLFGQAYTPLILIQILISLGTIFITYLIAQRLWQNTCIAVISSGLLAFDMLSFVYSQYILTETLFTCCLCAAILAWMHSIRTPRSSFIGVMISGILFSLTTLIRPMTYYAIILIMLFWGFIWKTHQHLSWRKTSAMMMAFLIPWVLLVGGWQMRNYVLTGCADISLIQGINLLFYRGAGIVAQQQGCSFEDARQQLGYAQYRKLRSDPNTTGALLAQYNQRWTREGIRLIRQHPILFFYDQARGAFRMLFETDWNSLPTYLLGDTQHTSGPAGDLLHLTFAHYIQRWLIENPQYFLLFMMSVSYLILVYSGVLISFFHFIQHRSPGWPFHSFLFMIIGYVIVISAGPEAYSRFRLPLMPLLCAYAGLGVFRILCRFLKITKIFDTALVGDIHKTRVEKNF